MSDSHSPVKILIADDHPIIVVALAEMMKATLADRDIRVDSVTDGDHLLRALEVEPRDYLVLDLHMPGRLKSVPLLQAVLAIQPALRVVVYTGSDQPLSGAGDSGIRRPRLCHQIKWAAGGDRSDPRSVRRADFRGSGYRSGRGEKPPLVPLTSGKRAVLVALARGENLQAIAIDSERSYQTVTTHKYNALRKLGLRSKDEIGHYLDHHGLGYLLG